MKLLLIEDNPDDLVLLSALLRHHGYEVLSALSADIALKILEVNCEIDAVIFDLMMPCMSGLEFMEVIRRDPRWARLPAVGRTALAAEDLPNDMERLKFALLQKPHTVDELETVLAGVCGADKLPKRVAAR